MSRKSVSLLLLAGVTLLQTSPSPLHTFLLEPAGIVSVANPSGISPLIVPSQADLNGDGIPEQLALAGGQLSILSRDTPVWQSPTDWQVIQAAFSDLNLDGVPEVTLLLWRPFRPWPVDQWLPNAGRIDSFQDAAGRSCHIILIGWSRQKYRELWAGSAMAEPITSFAVADLNGDKQQELVALEGRYSDPRSAPARTLKVWEWNGFGFTVVSYMNRSFIGFTLVQAREGNILILVP